jgi:hypothetical protein
MTAKRFMKALLSPRRAIAGPALAIKPAKMQGLQMAA